MRCRTMLVVIAAFGLVTGPVEGSSNIVTYVGRLIGNSKETARKVFSNIDITEYSARYAAAGTYYGADYTYLNGSGRGTYLPMSETRSVVGGANRLTVTFNLFRMVEGVSTQYSTYEYKTVFEQRGDDVYAWVSWGLQSRTAPVNGSLFFWNMDMASMFDGGDGRIARAYMGYDLSDGSDPTAWDKGYGFDEVCLQRTTGCATVTPDDNPGNQPLNIPDDVKYVAEGASAFGGVDDFTGAIDVDGELVVRNRAGLSLSGRVTGGGDISFEATEPRSGVSDEVSQTESDFMAATWALVARNRLLASLTSVTGRIIGARISSASRYTAAIRHLRNDGGYATVQFFAPNTAKQQCAALLQLKQCGPDIMGCISVYTINAETSLNASFGGTYHYGDFDLENSSVSDFTGLSLQSTPIATSISGSSVGLCAVGLKFETGSAPYDAALWGYNDMDTGARIRVSASNGARCALRACTLTNYRALPQNGRVDVGSGGVLFLEKVVSPLELRAHDGGMIFQATNNPTSSYQPIVLDGGSLYLGYQRMNTGVGRNQADAYTYLNQLRLMNGACVYGCRPRIGNDNSPMWTVGGTLPSRAMCGMRLLAKTMGPVVIEVEDVTNDDEVDFSMEGPVVLANASGSADFETWRNIYVLKTGAGTMSMRAQFAPYYPTVISNGTWQIAATNASSSSTSFELCGGSLSVLSNITVTAGEIVPRVSSTISIGTGAKLSIAAPSEAWANGVVLSVTGTDIEARDAFRIGTSACLSSAQLAAIRMNGHRVVQDENGYVKRRTGGMFLLFR